jgi:hypothetical protein
MTFKEWIDSLSPKRDHTPAEDFADSVALIVIMALIFLVVFG